MLYLQAMSSNYPASIEKTAASTTIIVMYTSYCLLMLITRQMYYVLPLTIVHVYIQDVIMSHLLHSHK